LTAFGCRRVELLSRLFPLARAPVELSEAEVAMGDERAHASWLGKGQRLAVVGHPACLTASEVPA